MLDFCELVQGELNGEDPLTGGEEEGSDWMRAEALRKSGHYREAAATFYEAWESQRTWAAGWRYAHCLRKGGEPEAALRAICRVGQVHPDQSAVLMEKTWCIYEARLRPAVKQNSPALVIRYVREMAASGGSDALTVRLLIFSLSKVARAQAHWELLVDLCGRVDPALVSSVARRNEERQLMSDRERIYYAHLRGLAELSRWEELSSLAERALTDFPRNQDFTRSLCRSWRELGRREDALERLQATCRSGRARWYVKVDLARALYEHDQLQSAWEVALDAAGGPAEDAHKVVLWELMAAISSGQGRVECACDHLGFALALRSMQGWSLSSETQQLELALRQKGFIPTAHPAAQWKTRCRLHWELKPEPRPTANRRDGILCEILPGRAYAFVRSEGDLIYTLIRDIPEALRQEGKPVSFLPVPNYDPKKKRDSIKATDVRASTVRAATDFERF